MLILGTKIIGTNIDEGFIFPRKPTKSGNSKVISIPHELIDANQIPNEELEIRVRRKPTNKDQEGCN